MVQTVQVKAQYVVAFDNDEHVLIKNCDLVFKGSTVTYVGQNYPGSADVVIDATDKVITPGFISSHTHMSGSPFDKSLMDDTENPALGGTLYDVLMPIRKATTRDVAEASARASCLELLKSGVTTAVDLTGWGQETVRAAEESGLRLYIGQYIRSRNWSTDGDTVGYEELAADEIERLVAEAVGFISAHNSDEDTVRGFLAPAQVDTCSRELLQRIAELSDELDVPVQIHAGQSVTEYNNIMNATGLTPFEYLADVGLLNERLVIGHAIFRSGHSRIGDSQHDDLGTLAASGATVAHCPQVFTRHGQSLETLGEYLRRGVRVVLGLDTSPQSMLLEMRTAAQLGKVLGRTGHSVRARDLFRAATSDAADAFGRSDLGRLCVGSKADFLIFRTDSLSMTPCRDPIRNVVYSALPSDIDSVFVDGKALVEKGEITYGDESQILTDLQDAAETIWGTFNKYHPLGKSITEVAPLSLSTISTSGRDDSN